MDSKNHPEKFGRIICDEKKEKNCVRMLFTLYECTIMEEQFSLKNIRQCHGKFSVSITFLEEIKGKYLQFYMGGRVPATYEQLTDDQKRDYATVKAKLLAAYKMNGATAYSKFTSSSRKSGLTSTGRPKWNMWTFSGIRGSRKGKRSTPELKNRKTSWSGPLQQCWKSVQTGHTQLKQLQEQ